MKKIIPLTVAFVCVSSLFTNAQYWSALDKGVGLPFWSLVYYSDGTLTGSDAPVTGPALASVCIYNGELYAAGCYDVGGPTNNIMKWDGTNWSTVGLGVYTIGGGGYDSWINALLVYNGALYAAGRFTHAGSVEAINIAKWNGVEWSAVGAGLGEYGYEVVSLAEYNGLLYAGGHFYTSGTIQVNNIAKWNGVAWSAAGSGIDVYTEYFPYGSVSSLAVHNNELYASGLFDTTGGRNNIVKWNGSVWSGVGTGAHFPVYCLASYNGDIYAGGIGLRKWDGAGWATIDSNINGAVFTLKEIDGYLIAGGYFDSAGQKFARNIAKWDGSEWEAFGKGVDPGVLSVAGNNNDIYAGGYFKAAGDVWVNKIAKWTSQCSSVPEMPDSIIGNQIACTNRYSRFFVTPVSNASSFSWTLPNGWTGNSITNDITVLAGVQGGTITVKANNPCGSSDSIVLTLQVTDTVPAQIPMIAGPGLVCPSRNYTYSIDPVSSASSYLWILPYGWQGGSTTNELTVHTGSIGGVIAVRARNQCSYSDAQLLNVVVNNTLIQPGSITGPETVVTGQSAAYSTTPLTGAQSYTWTVSSGGTILSGQNTNSVTILWHTAGTHWVAYVPEGVCFINQPGSKTVTVTTITGLVDTANPVGLTALPNPSSGLIYLRVTGLQNKSLMLEVYSSTGALLFKKDYQLNSNNHTESLDLRKFAKGVYLIKTLIGGRVFTRKVVKN